MPRPNQWRISRRIWSPSTSSTQRRRQTTHMIARQLSGLGPLSTEVWRGMALSVSGSISRRSIVVPSLSTQLKPLVLRSQHKGRRHQTTTSRLRRLLRQRQHPPRLPHTIAVHLSALGPLSTEVQSGMAFSMSGSMPRRSIVAPSGCMQMKTIVLLSQQQQHQPLKLSFQRLRLLRHLRLHQLLHQRLRLRPHQHPHQRLHLRLRQRLHQRFRLRLRLLLHQRLRLRLALRLLLHLRLHLGLRLGLRLHHHRVSPSGFRAGRVHATSSNAVAQEIAAPRAGVIGTV